MTSEHAPDPPEVEDLLRGYSGALAFDVGAHVGYTAALLSESFERVVACEPHPRSYATLSTRTYPRRVQALPVAVSDTGPWTPMQVRAEKDRDGQYTSADAPWPEWGPVTHTRRVRAVTVDQLRDTHGAPDLLKVDTEGAELRVLRGATGTLEHDRPALFIEVHTEGLGRALRRALTPRYPDLRTVRHPHYPQGSWHADNHFWLITAAG